MYIHTDLVYIYIHMSIYTSVRSVYLCKYSFNYATISSNVDLLRPV